MPNSLRVTHVYRRENGEWKIVHRHGDYLEFVKAQRGAGGAGEGTRTLDIQLGSDLPIFEIRVAENPCSSIRFGILRVVPDTPSSALDHGRQPPRGRVNAHSVALG